MLNKSDLAQEEPNAFYSQSFCHSVLLSAKKQEGLDRLRQTVEELFTNGELDLRNDAVLTNARQHAAALSALEAVRRALSALALGAPIDLCCTDAESAMSALQELDGRAVSEDIVAQIFSKFCVGK